MPAIELDSLRDVVDAAAFAALPEALARGTNDEVEREVVLEDIDGVALEEFVERLEADAADLYLPTARAPVLKLGHLRFGSVRSLLERLGSLREALELDAPADERTRALSRQRAIWKALSKAAHASLKTGQVVVLTDF